LSDSSSRRQRTTEVVNFLSDDYVHALLKDPASAFAPPNDATEKDFETKTAPINVTAAASERYDVKLLKEEAKWLSKSAKLNLVAALRIAVLEVQSRPNRHLLGPLSSQDAANLQEAAGLQNGQRTSFMTEFGFGNAQDADEISAEFDKVDSRKRRLFDIFLTERRCFIMTMDYLQSIRLYGRLPIFTAANDKLAPLYKLKASPNAKDESVSFLSAYLRVIASSMTSVEAGLKSVTDDIVLLRDDVELVWLETLLTEVIHSQSVVFQLVDTLGNDFPPSSVINQWFSLMDLYNFFDTIQPVRNT
jgi:nuclear pore complex protein Nup188